MMHDVPPRLEKDRRPHLSFRRLKVSDLHVRYGEGEMRISAGRAAIDRAEKHAKRRRCISEEVVTAPPTMERPGLGGPMLLEPLCDHGHSRHIAHQPSQVCS